MYSLLLLLLTACTIAGCGPSKEEQHRLSRLERQRLDSIDRASLKVGVMPTLDCLPVYVAKSEHLFDTLGVDVHLRKYTAQMDCDTALERGRVEGSVTDLIRALRMQQRGTKLLFPIATNTYWQLISNHKSRISELKQLSDKMIAITRHSATDYLADLAIDSAKPKYDVYRVQINDVNVRLKMLLNNEMDAALLTEPQATKALLSGHRLLMDSRDKNLRLGVFAFRETAMSDKRRKEQLQRFLQGYNMAVDSINKHGVQYYAELIKSQCGADAKTIGKLPRLKFAKAQEPRNYDLTRAEKRAR